MQVLAPPNKHPMIFFTTKIEILLSMNYFWSTIVELWCWSWGNQEQFYLGKMQFYLKIYIISKITLKVKYQQMHAFVYTWSQLMMNGIISFWWYHQNRNAYMFYTSTQIWHSSFKINTWEPGSSSLYAMFSSIHTKGSLKSQTYKIHTGKKIFEA